MQSAPVQDGGRHHQCTFHAVTVSHKLLGVGVQAQFTVGHAACIIRGPVDFFTLRLCENFTVSKIHQLLVGLPIDLRRHDGVSLNYFRT